MSVPKESQPTILHLAFARNQLLNVLHRRIQQEPQRITEPKPYMTLELLAFLDEKPTDRQVFIRMERRNTPIVDDLRESLLNGSLSPTEQQETRTRIFKTEEAVYRLNLIDIVNELEAEKERRELDPSLQQGRFDFNPLYGSSSVALIADSGYIRKLMERDDIQAMLPDEPEQILAPVKKGFVVEDKWIPESHVVDVFSFVNKDPLSLPDTEEK